MRVPDMGDLAPDFTLPGVPPGEYRLSDQRGKRVVLAFYPGDFTPVCTTQLASYAEHFDTFEETGAVLWGISVDDLEKHERFAKARALGFPLLADTEGEVSKLYGVLGLLGKSKRSVFVIDEEGIITWRADEPIGLSFRELDEIVAHLDELDAARQDAPGGSERRV